MENDFNEPGEKYLALCGKCGNHLHRGDSVVAMLGYIFCDDQCSERWATQHMDEILAALGEDVVLG